MKLLKSILVSSLFLAASSSFAAPAVKSVVNSQKTADKALFWAWSSVCVNNVEDGAADVPASYRWGTEGDFTAFTAEPNTQYIFSERFPTDMQPDVLTVKFMNKEGTDGVEISYDLDKTETRFRQGNCANVENYGFQKADGPEATLDLVKAEQP